MVTKTNYKAPWIIYEAGALSKTVQSRVIPILCNMNILDIANTPLSQFNCALATKHEFWAVIAAINAKCQRPIEEFRLQKTFEKWWPDFEKEYKEIQFDKEEETGKRDDKADTHRIAKIENVLEDVMRSLRSIQSSVENNRFFRQTTDTSISDIITSPYTIYGGPIATSSSTPVVVRDAEGKARTIYLRRRQAAQNAQSTEPKDNQSKD